MRKWGGEFYLTSDHCCLVNDLDGQGHLVSFPVTDVDILNDLESMMMASPVS